MRKKEREIIDLDEIEGIIQKAKVCRVAFANGHEPYIVPVCFGYERACPGSTESPRSEQSRRGVLYVHGADAGRKLDIMKKNNKVCFEIDEDVVILPGEKACSFAMKYRSVVGIGKAAVLKKDEDKLHGLNVIMKHYAGHEYDFTKKELDSVLVWKVDIDSLTGKKARY